MVAVHFCVVPGCVDSSSTHPNLAFHHLLLKKKAVKGVQPYGQRTGSQIIPVHFYFLPKSARD